ncbi:MAG: hypothetical protein ACLQVM_10730 [Terriglobia bacterium]
MTHRANPYIPPAFKLFGLEEPSRLVGTLPGGFPQSATPHNADQALLSVYDALHGALKANASLTGGSTNPTPQNADQVLLATFDSTNGALRINCVVGCAGNFQVNGTGLTSSSTINFQSSSATNGLALTFSNPSAGNIQLGLSGTLGDAGLSNAYSGVGACAANTWASTLGRNAAPTCTQPAISNLTATISSPLLLNSNTLSIQQANGSQSGYLLSGDWTTFNSKQAALTFNSPLQNSSNTISCPNCEVTTNKNGSNGYAGLSGGLLSASQLPTPTTSTLGGVESLAQTGHQWINSISTSGVPAASQPGVADLSDTPARGQVLAGPSAYGASAATGAYRALVPQDIPSGLLSCAVLDNAICTSHTDAAGNPDFLAAGAGAVIDVNGGTTALTYFVGGVYQQINSQLTVTPATPASDTSYFIIVKQDTAHANPVSADLVATAIVPVYQYTAPTCSASATATNPHFWYNLAANAAEWCTSNGGAFSVQASLVLGVVVVSSTPTVVAVLAEPYRLNPYKRFETFGSGADGVLTVTGSTTVDGAKQYSFVLIDGNSAVLQHTSFGSLQQGRGLIFKSQNPVLLVNDGIIKVDGFGMGYNGSGTGAGSVGNNGGFAGLQGSGGGGGGAGATNSGGSGGAEQRFADNVGTLNGGGGGGTPTNAGGSGLNAGANNPILSFLNVPLLAGYAPSGGNGAGDGTNNGGRGGSGGGTIGFSAPSVLVASGSSVTANGNSGANGTSGGAPNYAAGGGGGGGGIAMLIAGFTSNGAGGTYTPTANGGAYGSGVNTGGHGGAGGNGTALAIKLW